MSLRLAIVVSHPIQHFAPWHREVAKVERLDLKVFFCCDWGTEEYLDPEFGRNVKWDIPLLDGYEFEFLPIRRRPKSLSYWQVDNPSIGSSLDHFSPDVVKVFGYSYRTNWRVAEWTKTNSKPLMLFSDSNGRIQKNGWRQFAKQTIVSRFYSKVDGALFVGDNNRAYHAKYGLPDNRLFPGALPIDRAQLVESVSEPKSARLSIREKYGIPEESFVVMFCGKYSPRKRPLDLVIAANEAMKRGSSVWCLLVGEGSERPRIEEYCRSNNVKNTTLTGFVNQSSIASYYAASDTIAVTSGEDPHPLVVTEGGVFGLPTIISDQVGCIGPNDTARPEVNALVYPCGDTAKLSEMIERLSQNQALHHQMARAAEAISRTQDVCIVAKSLSTAAHQLFELGPR